MKQKYISEIIDQKGGSRFSRMILLLVGIALVFDGYDYMIVAFTMSQIAEEMSLNMITLGSLGSFSLIGMLIGGFISGILADRYGRKRILIAGIICYSLLTIPIYFINSFDLFAICRICSGIGIGAVIPLGATYASEYAPTEKRGLYITLTRCFMMFGWILAGLAAMYFVPKFGWRLCYLVGGLPFVYAIILQFILPESAQWLMGRGRKGEVMVIIDKIQKNLKEPLPGFTVDHLLAVPQEPKSSLAALKTVVSRPYLRSTVAIWLIAFTTCSLSYGLSNWMPTVLLRSGYDVMASYGYSTLQNCLGIVGGIAAGMMADFIGRRRSAVFSFCLAIIAVLVMAEFGIGGNIIPACMFMGFAINYAYIAPSPITLELYPTEVRATAQACTTTVARIGGVITPIVIGGALQAGSAFTTVLIVFIIPLVIAIFLTVFMLKIETKGTRMEKLGAKGHSRMSHG